MAFQRPAIGLGQTFDFLGQIVVVQARVIVLAECSRLLRCPLGDILVVQPVHVVDLPSTALVLLGNRLVGDLPHQLALHRFREGGIVGQGRAKAPGPPITSRV